MSNLSTDSANDKPEEACGVFGIFAPEEDVAKLTYFGLFALQHRGQESAGIAVLDGEHLLMHKDMGLVSRVFDEEMLRTLTGEIAVGHTRYSTTGSSRRVNAQPVLSRTRLGPVVLAHNGNLVNSTQLRRELLERHHTLVATTDSEEIVHAIGEAVDDGMDWISGTIHALKRCKGAFSLVMGTPDRLMGTRDPNGVRPLVLGQLGERYVLASETCALNIIGATYLRDIEPGELVSITAEGLTSHRWAVAEPKLCIFEMIYFARPDSRMNGESLYMYRERLGEMLALQSPVEADVVIAVPDSGTPAAIGYARQAGIPFQQGLIKNHYVGRTFIQPTQSMREAGIKMKLNPLPDVLAGKRVVIVDDSIVRGTTSRKIVKALKDAGAKEVHMRISSPPVTHPCFYGIDTDSQDQLIAATKSVQEIAHHIGVDSLAYLSKAGMFEAASSTGTNFCAACFTGNYPIEVPDSMRHAKLMLEKPTVAT
ncbi:MAG: amidophosphoribosyltransferase [Anaerolineae bacterium]|nr:amidophosphoribosyltransferase [Gloeobacterales cyanobacterium ES-bin-313]